MNPGTLTAAKDRVTIPDIAGKYYPGWKHGKSCKSPFREDKKDSFSVYDNGRRFKDFATGQHGDTIDFLKLASGLDAAGAILEFKRLAGLDTEPIRPPPPEVKKRITFPSDLHAGTSDELKQLSALRNVSIEGLQLATARGLLFFGTLDGLPCFIITDGTRRNAQARRLDGQEIQTLTGATKAKTLPGASAAWPIGAALVQNFPCIALCEGGPDLLAAFHFIDLESCQENWTAVCMPGASLQIHSEALPLFSGKHIRIFPHLDTPGHAAAARWERQLADAGAQTEVFSLQDIPTEKGLAKDLNDLCSLTADVWEFDRDLQNIFTANNNTEEKQNEFKVIFDD